MTILGIARVVGMGSLESLFINPQHWVSITPTGQKRNIDDEMYPIYDMLLTDGSVIDNVAFIEEKDINGIGRGLKDKM
jgi:hypothetical protein